MPLAPGQTPHYKIFASLGAGGMGEVCCAKDARLEREVAAAGTPSPPSQVPH